LNPGGFAGVTNVNEASDFAVVADEVVNYVRAIVAGVKSTPTLTLKEVAFACSERVFDRPTQVLQCFDEISDVSCRLLDPAMLCANVHPSREWQSAAYNVVARLTNLFHELNADYEMFERLRSEMTAAERDAQHAGLSESDWRLGRAMMHEFSRNGIDLDESGRTALKQLNERITELGMALNESELPAGRDSDSGDASVRRRQYFARVAGDKPRRRVEQFEALLAARHALAVSMGAPSYAAYCARTPRVAGSSGAIERFLVRVADALAPRAASEFERLTTAKRALRKRADSADARVEAWDVSYLRSLVVNSEINDADLNNVLEYVCTVVTCMCACVHRCLTTSHSTTACTASTCSRRACSAFDCIARCQSAASAGRATSSN
jgi:Zn-dependent oligopeptidase